MSSRNSIFSGNRSISIIALLLLPTAQAASLQQQQFKIVSLLIEENQPAAACTLLKRMTVSPSLEAQHMFLMSQCLRDMNQIPEAIEAMERVVVLAPQLVTPRLELASLNARLGRAGATQSHLVAAASLDSSNSLSPTVRTLIERLSSNDPAALARARTRAKPWQLELFSGLVYDTNINGGPSSDLISATVGNISGTIKLDPEARPKHAWGAMESITGSYRQPLGARSSVFYQAGLNRTDYFGQPRYRNDGLSLAAALIYQGQDYSVSVQPSLRYVRQTNQLQESDTGVSARFTKAISPTWNLNLAAEYMDRRMRQDRQRDAHSYSASMGSDVLLAPNIKLGASYTLMREHARHDAYSRRVSAPSAYVLWQPRYDLQLIANYRYQKASYDQKMAFFPSPRQDKQHTASLTALWDISRYTGHDISVRLQYLYTSNPSTVGLYDYDRQLTMAGLQFRF